MTPIGAATLDPPAARRPIARIFRVRSESVVRWCVHRRVPADAISLLSFVAAALAAACLFRASAHPFSLLLAPLFCHLRLWCNLLDGMVARGRGTDFVEVFAWDLPIRVLTGLLGVPPEDASEFRGWV